MHHTIESGKDKVKEICDVLRKETLEPAMEEAKTILDEAKKKAEGVLGNAREKAAEMIQAAEQEIEKKENVYKASLHQGARQSVEWLKEQIEKNLLNAKLSSLIAKASSPPEVIARMIEAVIKGVQEEGLDADFTAIVPAAVQAEQIAGLLGQEALTALGENNIVIGPQAGGIALKLHKENITIDLTDSALLELAIRFVRKDFQKFFFANQKGL